jgi:hypothetical protein
MVWRFTKTLTVVVAVFCIGCAGTMGSSYTGTSGSARSGAAVGEAGGTTGSIEDRNIQNSSEPWNSWDTRRWNRDSNFGANPALGSPVPPGFNWPGGGGGDGGE